MPLNWASAYNRLFEIIDSPDEAYFSGPRFIRKVQEQDPYHSNYRQYIDFRNQKALSTSRRDYFYDILMSLDEPRRLNIFNSILDDVHTHKPELSSALRAYLGGQAVHGPAAFIPVEAWNANRLNDYLAQIEASINASDFERAITLSYTTLEGFYKAFLRKNAPEHAGLNEIVALSREVRRWLGNEFNAYPNEVLNLINSISHAIDRARNRYSEAHFEEEAAKWLAVYVRDLLNTQVRLLLHFM